MNNQNGGEGEPQPSTSAGVAAPENFQRLSTKTHKKLNTILKVLAAYVEEVDQLRVPRAISLSMKLKALIIQITAFQQNLSCELTKAQEAFIAHLQSTLQDVSLKADAYLSDKQWLEYQLESEKDKLTEMKRSMERVNETNAELKEKAVELAALKVEFRELERTSQEREKKWMEMENINMKEALDESEKLPDSLKATLASKDAQIVALEHELNEVKASNRRELEITRAQLQECRASLEALKTGEQSEKMPAKRKAGTSVDTNWDIKSELTKVLQKHERLWNDKALRSMDLMRRLFLCISLVDVDKSLLVKCVRKGLLDLGEDPEQCKVIFDYFKPRQPPQEKMARMIEGTSGTMVDLIQKESEEETDSKATNSEDTTEEVEDKLVAIALLVLGEKYWEELYPNYENLFNKVLKQTRQEKNTDPASDEVTDDGANEDGAANAQRLIDGCKDSFQMEEVQEEDADKIFVGGEQQEGAGKENENND